MSENIHLILGEVQLQVGEAETAVVEAAFDGKNPGFNLATFEAEGGVDEALNIARTLPMMAKVRVVAVRGMAQASDETLEALIEYAAKPNPSTVLVLSGGKLPPARGGRNMGSRLENAVKKTGRVQRFRAKDTHPVRFAMEEAAGHDCRMSRQAAEFLVEMVGTDLGCIRSEVAKAATWLGTAGEIDQKVVEEVSSQLAEAVVWDLTDAIVRRDRDAGLAAVHRMLAEAGPTDRVTYRLLALVTWQIRQLLELQESMRSGGDLPGSWRRVPGAKLRNARSLLGRQPLHPAKVFEALSTANRGFNSSRAGDRRIFEALVLELTS